MICIGMGRNHIIKGFNPLTADKIHDIIAVAVLACVYQKGLLYSTQNRIGVARTSITYIPRVSAVWATAALAALLEFAPPIFNEHDEDSRARLKV